MMKNKLKLKIDFKKAVLLLYKTRMVLFAALFLGLLLITLDVCYNKVYLRAVILEIDNGGDSYIRVEKIKLKEIIGEIEKRENNINKETTEEYQDPFDIIDKGEIEVSEDERKTLPPAMSR